MKEKTLLWYSFCVHTTKQSNFLVKSLLTKICSFSILRSKEWPLVVLIFPCVVYNSLSQFCVFIVQSYEQAFEQIKEATGITDIDQLVTKFIEGTCI